MKYDPNLSANENLAANNLRYRRHKGYTQVRDIIDESGAVVYVAGSADDLCAWMKAKAMEAQP